MDELYQQLKKFGKIKINEPLSKHTTFKIGGPTRYLLVINETEKMIEALDFLSGQGVDYLLIGGGSNVLMPDEGFDGVIIKVKSEKFIVDDTIISADAGVSLAEMVRVASANSLSGMEWAIGIPGTIGGAVIGNAGAMGKDMSDILIKVEVWQAGEILELSKDDCYFSYRHSALKDNKDVVLRAHIGLQKGERKDILALTQKYIIQRAGRIGKGYSCGCFFKNLELEKWPGSRDQLEKIFIERKKVPAGWLIEKAGCVGMSNGGARISEKHNSIIENDGTASRADVMALVEDIKEKVYNKFRVELEYEVQII
ncbi:MAG: UDP-N-acetylmuramate dehydrogenase [bacterium]